MASDFSNLFSSRNSSVYPTIFLHSEDGLTTPTITLLSISFNISIPDADPNTLCNFDGFIYDINAAVANEVVYVRPYRGFTNDTVLHKYTWTAIGTTDSEGWFSGNIYVQATGKYWEMKVGSQRYKFQLPSATEASFATLESFEVIEVE